MRNRAHRPVTLDTGMQADDPTPSKTRRKQDMHALQALGEALAELPPERLEGLDLPERLHDAILEAHRITGFEARRRHMQYIGRLMRSVDPAPIAARLDALRSVGQEAIARHHALERWRTQLMEDETAFTALAREHPGIDVQHLRTLVRGARKEQAAGKPPRLYRELFRALREALEEGDEEL